MARAATDIRGYLADETSQVVRKRILVAEHSGQAEQLTQLLWDTWRAIEPGLGADPVVLHLDFARIGELSDAISGDCLPYFSRRSSTGSSPLLRHLGQPQSGCFRHYPVDVP
jgi:hypothetical protein